MKLVTSTVSSPQMVDLAKKETEMFWKGISMKDVNHNDKTMWLAELKANHQVSVIQQQPMEYL